MLGSKRLAACARLAWWLGVGSAGVALQCCVDGDVPLTGYEYSPTITLQLISAGVGWTSMYSNWNTGDPTSQLMWWNLYVQVGQCRSSKARCIAHKTFHSSCSCQ
jgi:hypothetical protein